MHWEFFFLLFLAIAAITLLVLEKVPLSVVGVGLVVLTTAFGIIDAQEAIAGFANPAVVTIAALYVVGEGFLRTGAASILADRILHGTRGTELTVLLLVTTMAGVLSAFVNNTLVVVTFLPVIITICRDTGIAPSRLLIPLSYASILGGMCTLVGTSTNILVHGQLLKDNQPGLTMFETTGCGLVLAGVGILYMSLMGRRLLPTVPSLATQPATEALREFVTEVTVGRGSPLIGELVADIGRRKKGEGAQAVMLVRGERLVGPPFENLRVKAGDSLMISGPVQDLAVLQRESDSTTSPISPDRYDPRTMTFFELVLTPNSNLLGRPIRDLPLKHEHNAAIAGVLRAGQHHRQRFADMTLSGGDVVLAFGGDRSKESLRKSRDFHLIEGIAEQIHHLEKAPTAFLIIAAVIAMFVTGFLHIAIAALVGALLMVLTGCLTVRRAHDAVNWPVLIFIAGALALSEGAKKSGANQALADVITHGFGDLAPYALMAGLFMCTIVLTEILTNTAVAIILTPVAVAIGNAAQIEDPRALVMAVVFGASCCFANPLGYHTNLLVLGPGGYRFRDFLRVGLPLDLLLCAVGIIIIPWFWPI
jgi:di/tricarboxylate transporter